MVRYMMICSAFLLSSCMGWMNQEVKIELPPHDPRIVVNGVLNDGDDEIKLAITRSLGMQESGVVSTGLPNANIQMRINGNPVDGFQYLAGTKEYKSNHPVAAGDHIELEVDVPGYASVSSETEIPHPTELLSARFGSVNHGMGGMPKREVFFRIKDPGKEKRYYVLKFAQEQPGQPLRTAIQLTSNIPWIVPVYPFSVAFESAGPESSMEMQVLVLDMYYSGHSEDMKSYLILETIGKPLYDYLTTFYYHHNNQRPELFSGEPVPMPSNIQNGFGIFAGASSHMIRIEE